LYNEGKRIPYVQNIKSLEHQQGKQNDTFPKAYREDCSGEGRVQVTSQLMRRFSVRSGGLREFYEFSTAHISKV
jgi:hypothetical protein